MSGDKNYHLIIWWSCGSGYHINAPEEQKPNILNMPVDKAKLL